MNLTRDELTHRLASKVSAEDRTDRLRAVEQAGIAAANMTGAPEWDRFLSYVQVAADGADKLADSLRAKLESPALPDAEVAQTRIVLIQWRVRAEAFRAVIALPKDLLAAGEKARALLDRLEEKETADAA